MSQQQQATVSGGKRRERLPLGPAVGDDEAPETHLAPVGPVPPAPASALPPPALPSLASVSDAAAAEPTSGTKRRRLNDDGEAVEEEDNRKDDDDDHEDEDDGDDDEDGYEDDNDEEDEDEQDNVDDEKNKNGWSVKDAKAHRRKLANVKTWDELLEWLAVALEHNDLYWPDYKPDGYFTLGQDSTGGTHGPTYAQMCRRGILPFTSQESVVNVFGVITCPEAITERLNYQKGEARAKYSAVDEALVAGKPLLCRMHQRAYVDVYLSAEKAKQLFRWVTRMGLVGKTISIAALGADSEDPTALQLLRPDGKLESPTDDDKDVRATWTDVYDPSAGKFLLFDEQSTVFFPSETKEAYPDALVIPRVAFPYETPSEKWDLDTLILAKRELHRDLRVALRQKRDDLVFVQVRDLNPGSSELFPGGMSAWVVNHFE